MALTRIKTDQVLDGTITNDDLASDIALNTSGDITTSGDISAANVTLTGELNGPATFYIDPAPHDPDTDGSTNGLVVIRGDLQVDGTTTTVNSTTVEVADKNIVLGANATANTQNDGAGITILRPESVTNVTFNWNHAENSLQANKPITVAITGSYVTTVQPDLALVNLTQGAKLTLRGLSPTISFDKTGTNTRAKLLLDNGAMSWYDGELDAEGDRLMTLSAFGSLAVGAHEPSMKLHVIDAGVTDNAWNDLAGFAPEITGDDPAESSLFIETYPSTTSVPNRRVAITSKTTAGVAVPLILNRAGSKVGIGEESPVAKLDIYNNQDHADLYLTNDGYDCTITMFSHRNVSNHNTILGFASRGTQASPATLQDDDYMLRILGRGYNTSDGTYNPSTEIAFVVDGEPNTASDPSDMPGRIEFKTAADGTDSETIRMVIKNNGRVGVGTQEPDALFQVEWTGTNTSDNSISRITAPTYPSLEFYSTDTATNNRNWKLSSVYNSYGTFEFLRSAAANGAPNITVMAMDKDGNVGIGISSPDAKLHVESVIGEHGGTATTPDFPVIIAQNDTDNDINQLGGSGVGIMFKNATNSVSATGAAIASIKATGDDDDSSAELALYVSNNDDVLDEAVRIDSSGLVGIGTNDPQTILHINASNPEIRLQPAADTDTSRIRFRNAADDSSRGQISYDHTNQKLVFNVTGDHVWLTNSGRVGIGIDAPDRELEIYNSSPTTNTGIKIHNDSSSHAAILELAGQRETDSADISQVLTVNKGYSVTDIISRRVGDDGGTFEFKTSNTGSGQNMSTALTIDQNQNVIASSGYVLAGDSAGYSTNAVHDGVTFRQFQPIFTSAYSQELGTVFSMDDTTDGTYYWHLLMPTAWAGQFKLTVTTQRSGGEYIFGTSSIEGYKYTEGDGDFRHLSMQELKNTNSGYGYYFYIGDYITGYLAEAATDTSENFSASSADFFIVRMPITINSFGSGSAEFWAKLETHGPYRNDTGFYIGVM